MFSSHTSLTEIAPQPWETPIVSDEISSKILYYPISHPSVKSIKIKESEEPFIDLLKINNPRLRPLSSFNGAYKNIYEGWSKVRLGVYSRLLKMIELLPNNTGIAYSEGFRTLAQQKKYFDKKFLEVFQQIPDKHQAYLETTKYVSPFIDNIPTHATGAAIDMTLFTVNNGKKSLLDMGKYDTIFGPNNQQETFSKNTTIIQRKNRLLLLESAVKAGLASYGFEWWHYSYGDKVHALVYNKTHAIYGLDADKDNPILSIAETEYIREITDKMKQ